MLYIPYWSLPADERVTSFDVYDTFLDLDHVRYRYIYAYTHIYVFYSSYACIYTLPVPPRRRASHILRLLRHLSRPRSLAILIQICICIYIDYIYVIYTLLVSPCRRARHFARLLRHLLRPRPRAILIQICICIYIDYIYVIYTLLVSPCPRARHFARRLRHLPRPRSRVIQIHIRIHIYRYSIFFICMYAYPTGLSLPKSAAHRSTCTTHSSISNTCVSDIYTIHIQRGHIMHRELIRGWLWEPTGSSLEYI